jgi:hypothetical protein
MHVLKKWITSNIRTSAECAKPPQVPEGGLVLEHVAEELLHGRGADGLLEVDALHVGGGHGLQRGEGQQQPGEPRALPGPQRTISPNGEILVVSKSMCIGKHVLYPKCVSLMHGLLSP